MEETAFDYIAVGKSGDLTVPPADAGFPDEEDNAGPPGYVAPPPDSDDDDGYPDEEYTHVTDDEEDHKAKTNTGLGIRLPSQSMDVFYAAKAATILARRVHSRVPISLDDVEHTDKRRRKTNAAGSTSAESVQDVAARGANHTHLHRRNGNKQSAAKRKQSMMAYAQIDDNEPRSIRRNALLSVNPQDLETTVNDMKEFDDLAAITKSQPIAMKAKREVMAAHRQERQVIRAEISRWSMLKYKIGYAFSSAWETFTSGLSNINIWETRIKEVEGGHGSHVGIYFKFMRWNMMLNLTMGLLWGMTVSLPQLLQTNKIARRVVLGEMNPSPVDGPTDYWAALSPLDVAEGLARGSSILNHSEYFIGNYMQETGNFNESYRLGRSELRPYTGDGFQYYVPLAYLVMGIFTVAMSLVTLLSGVYTSVSSAVSSEDLNKHKMATLVFTEYDHAVTVHHAMDVHCKDNAEKCKEILGTAHALESYAMRMKEHKYWIYFKRVLINILVVAILVGSCFAISFATGKYIQETNFLLSIIPTLTMVALNAGIPFVFEAMAEAEEWESPLFVIIITVIRSTAEKVFVFAVFIISIQNNLRNHACWETAVGTETYSYFVVGVLTAEIFTSVFIDILLTGLHKLNKKISGTHINEHGELVHPPGMFPLPAYFDTVKKILELSFAQALIWFGVFFSPLLPLVGVVRCFILFYVQSWSTNTFCSPKGTPFQAKVSFSGVIWITLGVHLMVGFVPCWYLIMGETPSGIFRIENNHFVGTLYSPHEYDFDAKQFNVTRSWNTSSFGTEKTGDGSEVIFADQVPSHPDTAVGSEVRGWCIVRPNKTVAADSKLDFSLYISNERDFVQCEEKTWINVDVYTDGKLNNTYTGPADVDLDDGSTILQCAELPNMISGGCITVDIKTAGCDQCLESPSEAELDQFVCYESKENNTESGVLTAWLPHDCGVGVTLRTLCQRCPSGCGPFANREAVLDIFAENEATWDLESETVSAKANQVYISLLEFFASPPFTVLLFILLIVVWAVKSAHLAQKTGMITQLIRERAMDRIDKEWMLAEYGIQFEHNTDLNDNQDQVGKTALAHRKAAKAKSQLT